MKHVILLAALLATAPFISARAADDLARRASWSPLAAQDVKARLHAWLAERDLDPQSQAAVEALWPDGADVPADSLLDHLATTFAAVFPDTKPLVNLCRQADPVEAPPAYEFLADDSLPGFVRSNLRLLYGRWLAQHNFYDESLEQLTGLKPEEVIDPAALLFYQGVAHHRLLNKKECLDAIGTLMENPDDIPRRYAALARLMEADIKPLKTDSLDEVARLMEDIRRRLNFGRAGKRVRDEEDEVIAKLDKMIEDLEKQRQQMMAQQSGGGGSNAPSAPMQDSQAAGGGGPGNVDPRRVPGGDAWGNLPPKARQEALQAISDEFPSHYREAIEEYFRKLAKDGAQR
jgi:hypothetical protein